MDPTYDQFRDLLFVGELSLLTKLCDFVPEPKKKEISESLVNLAESQGKTKDMILHFVRMEVDKLGLQSEGSLFRQNSISSKMLTFYLNLHGKQYLHEVVGPFIRSIIEAGEEIDLNNEITDMAVIKKNSERIAALSNTILSRIFSSIDDMPHMFRALINGVSEIVALKFPASRYSVVGGILFLRFICPVLFAPTACGIVPETPKNAQRTLLMVSKVIQTTSNGVSFGEKEPFMIQLNDCVQQNRDKMAEFFQESARLDPTSDLSPRAVPKFTSESSWTAILSQLKMHLEKLAALEPPDEPYKKAIELLQNPQAGAATPVLKDESPDNKRLNRLANPNRLSQRAIKTEYLDGAQLFTKSYSSQTISLGSIGSVGSVGSPSRRQRLKSGVFSPLSPDTPEYNEHVRKDAKEVFAELEVVSTSSSPSGRSRTRTEAQTPPQAVKTTSISAEKYLENTSSFFSSVLNQVQVTSPHYLPVGEPRKSMSMRDLTDYARVHGELLDPRDYRRESKEHRDQSHYKESSRDRKEHRDREHGEYREHREQREHRESKDHRERQERSRSRSRRRSRSRSRSRSREPKDRHHREKRRDLLAEIKDSAGHRRRNSNAESRRTSSEKVDSPRRSHSRDSRRGSSKERRTRRSTREHDDRPDSERDRDRDKDRDRDRGKDREHRRDSSERREHGGREKRSSSRGRLRSSSSKELNVDERDLRRSSSKDSSRSSHRRAPSNENLSSNFRGSEYKEERERRAETRSRKDSRESQDSRELLGSQELMREPRRRDSSELRDIDLQASQ